MPFAAKKEFLTFKRRTRCHHPYIKHAPKTKHSLKKNTDSAATSKFALKLDNLHKNSGNTIKKEESQHWHKQMSIP